jgi:antitoxin MazE
MKTRIQKWGNSLAVRIPRGFASEARVADGSPVKLTIDGGRLVITPVKKPRHTLETLVRSITKQNIHAEITSGEARGREIW